MQTINPPESALLVANRSSGHGRTDAELTHLQGAFDESFRAIPERVFQVADSHDHVAEITREFLRTHPTHVFLLAGGGGGTNRALVQGLMEEVERGKTDLDNVWTSSLRLGSGNVVPQYLNVPMDPFQALGAIASSLFSGRTHPCCVYRVAFCYGDGRVKNQYGVTLGGLGLFATVPDQIKRWKARHTRVMRAALRVMPLETINSIQYLTFTTANILRGISQPEFAARVQIESRSYRLLTAFLLNLDLPQIPIHAKHDVGEPRLVLACLPYRGRFQTLWTLVNFRNLDARVYKYDIIPKRPIEISFVEKDSIIVALDEDTFVAPNRIRFEVAGVMKFVAGTWPRRIGRTKNESLYQHHRH